MLGRLSHVRGFALHPLIHRGKSMPRPGTANGQFKQVYTLYLQVYCLRLLPRHYAQRRARPHGKTRMQGRIGLGTPKGIYEVISVGGTAFNVDAMQVCLDRARADDQLAGDVLGVVALQHQCEHFLLAP